MRICRAAQRDPPGSAGVPPASLCLIPLAGAELSSGAEGSQPVGSNLNGQTEADPRRSSGSIRVAERAKPVPDIVRAGRPRSRGGILHTINREQGLLHARESGKAPGSALKYHSPLEGESANHVRLAQRAKPVVEPEGGQRHLPGITTLPGNKSRLLKNFARKRIGDVVELLE